MRSIPPRGKPHKRVCCPQCDRIVAVDRLGRYVGHGPYASCPGSFEMVQP
jgi:hypothetical protein